MLNKYNRICTRTKYLYNFGKNKKTILPIALYDECFLNGRSE